MTRLVCKGVSYELELMLDINSEVFPMKVHEQFTFALVSTLDLEGKPDDGIFDQSGKVRSIDKRYRQQSWPVVVADVIVNQ